MPVTWILLLSGCLIDRALYEQRLAELRREEGTVSSDGSGDSGGDDTSATDTDADGDGYPWGDDCDDGDPDVHPGAAETCDGADDDCDGEIDDGLEEHTWFADSDHDGWGNTYVTYTGCAAPESFVDVDRDCDDTDATVNPDAVDVIDGVDNDCDEMLDVEGMRDLGPAWLGATAFGHAGSAMAVGDLDGDGSDDLVVAGLGDSTWPDSEAFVSVVMSGVSEGGSLADADVVLTAGVDTQFGASVAILQAESGARLAVGAPDAAWGERGGGSAVVVDPSVSPSDPTADGIILWSEHGGASGFGYEVIDAGDWDGDGIGDMAIGHVGTAVDEIAGAGVTFVLPIPETNAVVDDVATATILGQDDKGHLGMAISGGQDLDGDGYDDLIVGAPQVQGEKGSGAAYLFHGGSPGGPIEDADATFVSESGMSGLRAGVAFFDDFDGDGRGEVAVGNQGSPEASGGEVFIYQGDLSGTYGSAGAEIVIASDDVLADVGGHIGTIRETTTMVLGQPSDPGLGFGGGVHLVDGPASWEALAITEDFVHGDLEGDEAGTSMIAFGDTLFIGAPGADDGASGAGGVWMVPIPTDR